MEMWPVLADITVGLRSFVKQAKRFAVIVKDSRCCIGLAHERMRKARIQPEGSVVTLKLSLMVAKMKVAGSQILPDFRDLVIEVNGLQVGGAGPVVLH